MDLRQNTKKFKNYSYTKAKSCLLPNVVNQNFFISNLNSVLVRILHI